MQVRHRQHGHAGELPDCHDELFGGHSGLCFQSLHQRTVVAAKAGALHHCLAQAEDRAVVGAHVRLPSAYWMRPANSKIGRYNMTTMPPMTTPDTRHENGFEQARGPIDPARHLVIVENRDAFHHLAHVAALFADPEQALRDFGRQPVAVHRLGDRQSRLDVARGCDESGPQGAWSKSPAIAKANSIPMPLLSNMPRVR